MVTLDAGSIAQLSLILLLFIFLDDLALPGAILINQMDAHAIIMIKHAMHTSRD
jgi:hypothetical protein